MSEKDQVNEELHPLDDEQIDGVGVSGGYLPMRESPTRRIRCPHCGALCVNAGTAALDLFKRQHFDKCPSKGR